MPTVTKSVIVPHSVERMFELVDDVERYPEFLPWCSGSRVLERTPEVTRARLEIDYHGLRSQFSTRNVKHPPRRMDLELEDGPFERLEGQWRFSPLGDQGCRVELSIDYELASSAMSRLLTPVFGHIMETLVDRFVARAESP
ncbi:MAG: type II toxin-antitoxin system RatA family toxin [Burkholderiales bacterium]|nr:type II toxin-antitoxin system RatA family toxin [Burkholderiales bacterium]